MSSSHTSSCRGAGSGSTRSAAACAASTPTVFMTANPDPRARDARALGSRWLLTKPFSDVADPDRRGCGPRLATHRRDLTEASHALRTPLTAVKMALEGLAATRELTAEERHLAEIANCNSRQIERRGRRPPAQWPPRTRRLKLLELVSSSSILICAGAPWQCPAHGCGPAWVR